MSAQENGGGSAVDLDRSVEVAVAESGRVATLAVSRSRTAALDNEELMREALDALVSAGVVHGLDRGQVAAVVAARDGAAHPVARATLPTQSVDGELELLFADEVASDPLHTVAAGALLARCTPAHDGVDGVAVTGEPLHPHEVIAPALSAGPGTEGAVVAEGVTVVRALVGGRPRHEDGVVTVDEVVSVRAVAPRTAPIAIFGSLAVERDLVVGAHLTTTGGLRVGGDVERAHIESGGDVVVAGSCLGSHIVAGARGSIHHLLVESLGESAEQLTVVAAMAEQMVSTAQSAGRRLGGGEALRALLTSRYPDVQPALVGALRALGAEETMPEESVVDAITHAAHAVDAVMQGGQVTPGSVGVCAHRLSRATAMMRSTATRAARVEAGYMQACQVDVRGSLVLTGAGTFNVDAEVGGDLLAQAPGATVRGGTVRVHGRLITEQLGSSGGSTVRVLLEGVGSGRRLSAAVAHPGVEVECGGRSIVLDATALNFAVGFDEDNNVVCSEDPLG